MKAASRNFKGPHKKPVGLGPGKIFNLIIFELKKQHKQMACEKEAMGWAIKGFAAAPGVTQGLAAVITRYNDLMRLKADTLLVYPHASPELAPSFPTIKGLVTDTGGMLASVAAIAREYGISAVVGTSNATESISDGGVIRVDGTNGREGIVAKAKRHASLNSG